ncbi:MAG: cytochrome c [Rhodocyclaceae bacterium]|nr:cytochrome c [Rhodocyclaceae bacterium]
MRKTLVVGLALATMAGASFAQMKVEDQIKIRQAGYRFMAWNMGKIKANLDGTYNKDQVIAAANVIQSIANSGMGALYGPGTDKGVGFHETDVKPEFFQQGDKVKEVAMAFNKEANELAKVAVGGDAAAVKTQFGKVGETCKACHEKFRKEDKK